MYHLFSPHSFCVVLFVWCTVVYAHGRTYINVSFSCLYGVPLVYARGRTHIDRAFTWCTIYILHTHSVSSCLYGVPFTFCHGRTRIDGSSSCLYAVPLVYARIVLTLPGFIVIVWGTVCLVGVPFMFCLVLTLIGLVMSVRCTVSVRTRSYLHWWTFLVCVWYTVYVLCLYHVCMVYRWCFLFVSSFLYLSAVTFSCNY